MIFTQSNICLKCPIQKYILVKTLKFQENSIIEKYIWHYCHRWTKWLLTFFPTTTPRNLELGLRIEPSDSWLGLSPGPKWLMTYTLFTREPKTNVHRFGCQLSVPKVACDIMTNIHTITHIAFPASLVYVRSHCCLFISSLVLCQCPV